MGEHGQGAPQPTGTGTYRRTLVVAADEVHLVRVPELQGEQMQDHLARKLSPICSRQRKRRARAKQVRAVRVS